MKYNFDVLTLEGLESSFERERKKMTSWEWAKGGYEALYTSQKKRLEKEKIIRDAETAKNKRAKR